MLGSNKLNTNFSEPTKHPGKEDKREQFDAQLKYSAPLDHNWIFWYITLIVRDRFGQIFYS